jgi:hypothetical protein
VIFGFAKLFQLGVDIAEVVVRDTLRTGVSHLLE